MSASNPHGGARYDVEAVIGRGAMGVVYRARQIGTGRVVAYKRVSAADPQLLARLRREADALARLEHPHIVGIVDVVEDGDGMAIVMQYAGGGTLADVLARRGSLPAEPAARLLAAIADALASAHRSGVLHRDVKPGNILFTTEGHPLLSDFGVAQVDSAEPLTAAGALAPATGEYLDPVVADGGTYDARSDCYALGVVAYELLTGRRPFRGATPLAVLRAADAGRFTPLRELAPDTPPALVAVVEAALAREPQQRPAGAAEMAAALRAAVGAAPLEQVSAITSNSRSLNADAGSPAPVDDAHDPPTRRFGPGPPPPPAVEAAAKIPWRHVAVAAVVALLLPLGTVAAVSRDAPAAPAAVPPAAQAPSAPPPQQPAIPATIPLCDGIDVPVARTDEVVLTGDLDGSGCRSWVRYRDRLLQARLGDHKLRVFVGQAGDTLLLGDWDCNSTETVALYRPATGEVFTFNSWAQDGEPLSSEPAQHTGMVGGEVQVEHRDGCATVVVTPPAGSGV